MARAYSHDLRVRVLDAVGAGLSRRAAALRYRVGIATVIRWAAHATTTGETRAQRQGRPPAQPSAQDERGECKLPESRHAAQRRDSADVDDRQSADHIG